MVGFMSGASLCEPRLYDGRAQMAHKGERYENAHGEEYCRIDDSGNSKLFRYGQYG
jgi:hypothetical protein